MEEMKEQKKEDNSKENKEEKASSFGVTLLYIVLAVVIGFTVLLCMQ